MTEFKLGEIGDTGALKVSAMLEAVVGHPKCTNFLAEVLNLIASMPVDEESGLINEDDVELLVTMLKLASGGDCGASGASFVTDGKRRDKMLLALVAGCKKDSLRSVCVPLASSLLSALPAQTLSALLQEANHPFKALVQALLPRRLALASEEIEAIEVLLLALGAAQNDAAWVLSLINDGLAGPVASVPASQRVLYVRVLQKLADRSPGAIPQHMCKSLLELLRPVLRAEGVAAAAASESADMTIGSDANGGGLGGSGGGGSAPTAPGLAPNLSPERNALLPAVLLCLPSLWSARADLASSTGGVDAEDEAELALISRLIRSVDRSVCHAQGQVWVGRKATPPGGGQRAPDQEPAGQASYRARPGCDREGSHKHHECACHALERRRAAVAGERVPDVPRQVYGRASQALGAAETCVDAAHAQASVEGLVSFEGRVL